MVSAHPAQMRAPPQVEHVNLAGQTDSNWVDVNTCMFNVHLDSDSSQKISTIVKVFSNQQILVTITDNDKFGSTFSAKKVSLDVENDPMSMMMYGGPAMGGAEMYDPDLDGDLDGGISNQPLPKDVVEVQLLLGDRKSQEVGQLFAENLFRMIGALPKFAGLDSMVLQVSLDTLRRPASERMAQQQEIKTILGLIEDKLRGKP